MHETSLWVGLNNTKIKILCEGKLQTMKWMENLESIKHITAGHLQKV